LLRPCVYIRFVSRGSKKFEIIWPRPIFKGIVSRDWGGLQKVHCTDTGTVRSLKLSGLCLFLILRMTPTLVRFNPGFPPEEHVFREFSGAPAVIRTTLEQPHFRGSLFRRISRRAVVIRAMLEPISLREILLL
jgi:hypothetical protein